MQKLEQGQWEWKSKKVLAEKLRLILFLLKCFAAECVHSTWLPQSHLLF